MQEPNNLGDEYPGTDWNEDTKTVFYESLDEVPEAGPILGGLVEIFWPSSGDDIWGKIKDLVEEIVQQAISDQIDKQITDDLTGLNSNLADYNNALQTWQNAVASGDQSNIDKAASDVKTYFISCKEIFVNQQPNFQEEGYETLLLQHFAQFMNMYLGLLRDGIVSGTDWGMEADNVDSLKNEIVTKISDSTDYVQKWFQDGLDNLKHSDPSSHKKTVIWGETNRYVREYMLGAMDYLAFWHYMDPVKYPDGVDKATILANLPREIFTDPCGTADDSTIEYPPYPYDKITAMRIWGWDRLDAVQVRTGTTWGPRQGDESGGSDDPTQGHGWNGDISEDNPVVEATTCGGQIVSRINLQFNDTTKTGKCGGNAQGCTSVAYSFQDHILSSIKIMGISNYYGSADCIVFGFRYEDSYGSVPQPVSVAKSFTHYASDPCDLLSVGTYEVSWQSDGNLVVNRIDAGAIRVKLWNSGTSGKGDRLQFRSDGDLMLNDSKGNHLWNSNTGEDAFVDGKGGEKMILYPDTGNLVIVNADERVLWATIPQTEQRAKGFTHYTSDPSELLICNGYKVTWQSDGDLALYHNDNRKWHSGTGGKGYRLQFRTDGELMINDENGNHKWSAGTSDDKNNGNGGRYMTLNPDGRFSIFNANNTEIWHKKP